MVIDLLAWQKTFVLKLTEPYYNTNRNVFVDRYFTSHSLIVELLQNGLTCTGTIPSNRRDVPTSIKSSRRIQPLASRFIWDHEHRIVLCSYCPKKNRNVLLMSSFHTNNNIDIERQDQKPEIILDYNAGKSGVDIMDSRVADFACRRKTNK